MKQKQTSRRIFDIKRRNKNAKTAVKRFSCFSQSQSASAVCAPRHKQRIPDCDWLNQLKCFTSILASWFGSNKSLISVSFQLCEQLKSAVTLYTHQSSFRKPGTMGPLASQAHILMSGCKHRSARGNPGISPRKIFEIIYAKSCNIVHFWRS